MAVQIEVRTCPCAAGPEGISIGSPMRAMSSTGTSIRSSSVRRVPASTMVTGRHTGARAGAANSVRSSSPAVSSPAMEGSASGTPTRILPAELPAVVPGAVESSAGESVAELRAPARGARPGAGLEPSPSTVVLAGGLPLRAPEAAAIAEKSTSSPTGGLCTEGGSPAPSGTTRTAAPPRNRATSSSGRCVADSPMRCSGRPARCSSRSRDNARCAPRLVGTRAWISSTMTVSTLRSASRALEVNSR
jgi:hypothetical protein